jgi:hypothetical protein|tara:strand:- start:2037 stop:2270 length:234 start_codon:yes stop_codon:yes gene_type:complete
MFKIVMGLIDKINKNNQEKLIKEIPKNDIEDILLNNDELTFMLKIIKDSTFKGEQIEVIYNLTWKIQQALLSLRDNK